MLRIAALALLAISFGWLFIDAPGATWREYWFLFGILLLTIPTRSMRAGYALSALGLGLGLVPMLMIAAGHVLTAVGLDTSAGVGNWGVIPLLEELLKLLPVAVVAWLYGRRRGLEPNPSDLLALGCAAGAGFALAENALLVANHAGIARDMARQYGPHLGPFYLVPGAWGAAGYVGHAAATGLVTATLGLGLALRSRLGTSWRMVPAAGLAWIVIEHVLTNVYVGSGSDAALLLGNGRLTPWLFVAVAAAVVILDARRGAAVLKHSKTLSRRVRIVRAVLVRRSPAGQRSLLAGRRVLMALLLEINATAWFVRNDPRFTERTTS